MNGLFYHLVFQTALNHTAVEVGETVTSEVCSQMFLASGSCQTLQEFTFNGANYRLGTCQYFFEATESSHLQVQAASSLFINHIKCIVQLDLRFHKEKLF